MSGGAGFEIRTEAPADEAPVRHVNESAFETSVEAELVDAMRAGGDLVPGLCLVALSEEEIAGHIAFSRARLDPAGHEIIVLAPMAVLPELQRKGAGSALAKEGLRRAAETDFPLVSVLGHADYYPRFGFEPAKPLGVEAPFEVPDEAWMAYKLPRYTPETRGTVRYADAFGAET